MAAIKPVSTPVTTQLPAVQKQPNAGETKGFEYGGLKPGFEYGGKDGFEYGGKQGFEYGGKAKVNISGFDIEQKKSVAKK